MAKAKLFKIDKQQVIDVLKKRWWVMLIEFLVVGIVLVLDLVSKEYICKYLFNQPGQKADFLNGFIDFYYTQNTGAGFGILSDSTVALTVITIIVVVGLFAYLIIAQNQNEWLRISLIFICAGGIGNVVDRIGLGYVRDFIQFTFWKDFAVFNVADSFVTVGAFMLIIVLIIMLFKEGKKNREEFEKSQATNTNAVQENAVDPFEQPINEFLPNENETINASEDDVEDNPTTAPEQTDDKTE